MIRWTIALTAILVALSLSGCGALSTGGGESMGGDLTKGYVVASKSVVLDVKPDQRLFENDPSKTSPDRPFVANGQPISVGVNFIFFD
ncbi:MAG: hypothetical protein HY876_10790 [Coriobacteriales bacterium]|nr:hypothetical protein [Coriobacteriales bacterium]